jgi:hypothetical protein
MCPTGWFLPRAQGAEYLDETVGAILESGQIKKDDVLVRRQESAGVRMRQRPALPHHRRCPRTPLLLLRRHYGAVDLPGHEK